MTLITYPTRVHFADGVLEEALRSELEAHGFSRPLMLCEEEAIASETTERVYAGLPRRTRPKHVAIGPKDGKYATARMALAETRLLRPDVIVAYDSARAIAHARKVRHQMAAERGEGDRPLDIFAVPGIDGLPNPCRSSLEPVETLFDVASRSGLPSIVICDPTVSRCTSEPEALWAAIDAFARALEAYLSDAYNPPADGMALDGFDRALAQLRAGTLGGGAEDRRELMAAGLNATLAQQKGIGPTQLINDILREPHGNAVAAGAVTRVLLPGVLRARRQPEERMKRLLRCMGLSPETSLDQAVDAFLGGLPVAARLSDLGLTHGDLVKATEVIEGPLSTAIHTSAAGAMSIMEAVL